MQEKGKELFIKEQAWEYDFATSYILAAKEHQIVIQNGNSKTYGSYGYVFKEAALGQECLMLGCHNNYVYTFSIFQREGDQFSLTHINKFHSVLNPFIALLSKHTELFLIRNDYDFLVHRFENKLDVRQIKLSPQEFTICVHTLKGHQVAQIADMLQLKECSVRTYLNRALNKLDLDNKYKLFIWAINR
ncbi:helix-turn-helix transcriptional regulator [Yokenella regensburgei]|uniref:helix-turn-helix transcriptional regulator n=1 Tax=Yokenella regensburgei TaxID=158877 RepID=UPI0013757225|nr:LuxR C-terminal-related transcriptional regulator [Yokenella regensburgei]KAF1366690.1 DNA-binding CsgD family transcriptional regulator [Yokenella regensburgei]